MNNPTTLTVSVALLIISMLANAWFLSERTQLSELKADIERLTSRVERLTASVSILCVIAAEKFGIQIPPPLNSGR